MKNADLSEIYTLFKRYQEYANYYDDKILEYLDSLVTPYLETNDFTGANIALVKENPPQCLALFEVQSKINRLKRKYKESHNDN